MSKILKLLMLFSISILILLASYYLLQNDIVFHTDIARDFLLLDEISQKKFILIGPRASGLNGLFHGPLWLYLNYPVYWLTNGNPVIIGWWWLLLSLIFLISIFGISKKLFNENTAYLTTIFTACLVLPNAKGLFNPYGAMFVFPLFFYLVLRYISTLSVKYLVFSLFLCGLIVQFQLAFGLPILILTLLLYFYLLLKNKKYFHIFSFFCFINSLIHFYTI